MITAKTEIPPSRDNKKTIDSLTQFIGKRYGLGIAVDLHDNNCGENLILFFANDFHATSLAINSTPINERDYQSLKDRYHEETAINPNKRDEGIEKLIIYIDKAISQTRDRLRSQQGSVN